MSEPTVYEKSVPGRSGIDLPDLDVPPTSLPAELLRDDNGLPELSQLDVVRHYQRLAQRNYGVDTGFYPLGSCTMKYNPRLSERLARLNGFANTHPLQDPETVQANLAVLYELQTWLAEIGGFAGVSLQPAAGAHGELTGLLIIRAHHHARGDRERVQILIPDSAHGTNPASTSMAGFRTLQIPSDERGNIDLAAVRAACDESVAGIMLTNPNTLGLFEERIVEVVELVHGCGGLVYGDGANMNALTGVVRPGDLGVDVMHYNLHKTFATPHGGGGPGSGPVAVSEALVDYLPGPVADLTATDPTESGDTNESPRFGLFDPVHSIGPVGTAPGSFGVLMRAYVYLRLHGAEGLRHNAFHAVLNANYLRAKLRESYPVPFDRVCMHEFVCEGRVEGTAIRAIDISKRLIDHGFHPPTNYFPLTVAEALMIEPTETESRETIDAFAEAMARIAEEARTDPDLLTNAPHRAPVRRLDEVRAARHLVLRQGRE
ncbi:MAG: aminomethyl-transferring glycine dehydrogenase subunit GcvPB [Acidimicrobiales bacterium]